MGFGFFGRVQSIKCHIQIVVLVQLFQRWRDVLNGFDFCFTCHDKIVFIQISLKQLV